MRMTTNAAMGVVGSDAQAPATGSQAEVELERARLKWTLSRGRKWAGAGAAVSEREVRREAGLVWKEVVLHVEDPVCEDQQELFMTSVEPEPGEDGPAHRAAVVVLHGTSGSRAGELHRAEQLASRGIIGVVCDLRYHGDRRKRPGLEDYHAALIRAFERNAAMERRSGEHLWDAGNEYPFVFDNAVDLIAVADYLCARGDVDSSRLGVTGISLGGMVAWFASACDTRWSYCSPMIGVQGFVHAMMNDCYHARVDSLRPVFEHAAGGKDISPGTVREVWTRITPGLCEWFDRTCLGLVAPRPCLVMNGEHDPRCPAPGVLESANRAQEHYHRLECPKNFKVVIQQNVAHEVTRGMWDEVIGWFVQLGEEKEQAWRKHVSISRPFDDM